MQCPVPCAVAVSYRCKCRNLTKTKHNIYSYDIYILHKIYISGVSASCPVPTILYTERVLAGTPPLLAGPQSRVDTRTVNSVNTVTRKYLVTNRKYLVLHCYFDGAPAFPDKSQFLTAEAFCTFYYINSFYKLQRKMGKKWVKNVFMIHKTINLYDKYKFQAPLTY